MHCQPGNTVHSLASFFILCWATFIFLPGSFVCPIRKSLSPVLTDRSSVFVFWSINLKKVMPSVFCFRFPLREKREVLVSHHKCGSLRREEGPVERKLPKHKQPDEGQEERRDTETQWRVEKNTALFPPVTAAHQCTER